jgi:hypothetical protein
MNFLSAEKSRDERLRTIRCSADRLILPGGIEQIRPEIPTFLELILACIAFPAMPNGNGPWLDVKDPTGADFLDFRASTTHKKEQQPNKECSSDDTQDSDVVHRYPFFLVRKIGLE